MSTKRKKMNLAAQGLSAGLKSEKFKTPDAYSRHGTQIRGFVGKLLGCFGLSEPGSSIFPPPEATTACKDGSDYVLTGVKQSVANALVADLAVVWARLGRGPCWLMRPSLLTSVQLL